MHLVAPEGARHVVGDLEEEPATPDEARGVVGRHAEREVAVAVGRRRCGDDPNEKRTAGTTGCDTAETD